jgi:hypothetical protein
MKRARDIALKTRWVGVDELTPAPFHADLFPLPRDLSGLRRSFARHGFRSEYPVVVRAAARGLEIVCGVGRHIVARERGMRRVPVVVRRFESDVIARAYAIEDTLFNAYASSRLSVAHMVVLARALRECGVECVPREVWEAAGVSPSTYWRAVRCVDRALKGAVERLPALSDYDPVRLAAEIVRRELDPRFSLLLGGEIEVNTFAAHEIRVMGRGGRKRVESGKGVGITPRRGRSRARPGVVGVPNAASDETRPADGKRRGGKDANRTLFDLLPS